MECATHIDWIFFLHLHLAAESALNSGGNINHLKAQENDEDQAEESPTTSGRKPHLGAFPGLFCFFKWCLAGGQAHSASSAFIFLAWRTRRQLGEPEVRKVFQRQLEGKLWTLCINYVYSALPSNIVWMRQTPHSPSTKAKKVESKFALMPEKQCKQSECN